jgi:surface polysaccharide O-acyltransferase-like enzyme
MTNVLNPFNKQIEKIEQNIERLNSLLSVRGTGKTTKMLEKVLDAIIEAKPGSNFYVYASSYSVVRETLLPKMMDMCKNNKVVWDKRGLNLVFKGNVCIYFKSVEFLEDLMYSYIQIDGEFFDNSVQQMRWEKMLAQERQKLMNIKKELLY